MRSVFLHLLADTANSVVVMIAAGTSLAVQTEIGPDYDNYPKWKWVNYMDPVLSIIIVLLICLSTWPLIQETSLILLQTVPSHVSMKVLTEELLKEVKGVSGIHEFHVWQLAGDKFYASIHVKCATLQDYERISNEIKQFFDRRGIYETTIQAEIKSFGLEGTGSDVCLIPPDIDVVNSKAPLK